MKKYWKIIVVLISVIIIAVVGLILFMNSHKDISDGSLYDWSKSSETQKQKLVNDLIVKQFNTKEVSISEERQAKYSQMVYDCLNTVANNVDGIKEKSISDASSLCILGILIKENFK